MFEAIKFFDEDGNIVEFEVLEQTRVNGVDYLLIAEPEADEEESVALIVKDVSKPEDGDAIYEIVEDEAELDSVQKIFNELLDDFDVM